MLLQRKLPRLPDTADTILSLIVENLTYRDFSAKSSRSKSLPSLGRATFIELSPSTTGEPAEEKGPLLRPPAVEKVTHKFGNLSGAPRLSIFGPTTENQSILFSGLSRSVIDH